MRWIGRICGHDVEDIVTSNGVCHRKVKWYCSTPAIRRHCRAKTIVWQTWGGGAAAAKLNRVLEVKETNDVASECASLPVCYGDCGNRRRREEKLAIVIDIEKEVGPIENNHVALH